MIQVGYTTGVFDLFHIGHVNVLRSAKALCDRLIVGVSTDDLVKYKFKRSVIPFEERLQIVQACRYVDLAIPQASLDKFDAWRRYKFHKLFVGDDWFNHKDWEAYEFKLREVSVDVVYIPYTKSTSSTLINETLKSLRSIQTGRVTDNPTL